MVVRINRLWAERLLGTLFMSTTVSTAALGAGELIGRVGTADEFANTIPDVEIVALDV